MFFFFKQKTAYEMRISDWSSDVCSSDLLMSEALQKKDWKKARALSLRLSKEHNFAFLSPIIDGWISLGERKYAPPVLPEDGAIAQLTRRYLSQHQALQYLALEDRKSKRLNSSN